LKSFSIVIDPGHGGHDYGASASLNEKLYVGSLMNLVVAKKVHTRLLITTTNYACLTRHMDGFVELEDRLKIAKLLKPSAFVSIHCNAGPPTATGTETLYRTESDKVLAEEIQAALVAEVGLKNRGVRSDVDYLRKKLAVLSNLEIPSCLVELGFITNEHDMNVLADTDRTARAIVTGLNNWWDRICEEEG